MKKATQLGAVCLAIAMTVPAMGFQRPQGKSNDNKSSSKGSNRSGPRMGDWLRRNMNTSPAQQQQELERSDDFKRLNPQQQQRMLKQLNRFNNMSPEQKNRVITHIERFDRLSPEQKEKAEALHQQFHQLSPDRRQEIRRTLFNMRDMNPDERQKNLDSPQMKQKFSESERNIMKGYTSLGFPDNHAEEDGGGGPQEEM